MSDQKDEEKRDSKKRKWDESDPIDVPGTSARTPSPGLPLWVAGKKSRYFSINCLVFKLFVKAGKSRN